MIDGSLYQPIYLGILALLTVILSIKYHSYPQSRIYSSTRENISGSLLLMIFMTLFIGLRPLHRVFVDMMNYNVYFNFYSSGNYGHFSFDWDTENLLFDNFFYYLSVRGFDFDFFIFIIASVYFATMWWAIRRWFPKDTLFAFVMYLSAFSTFSYGTNGIKAGAAASIFLLALSYRNKLLISLLIAAISWCFHHSMSTVIATYILTLLIENPKYYVIGWLVCIFFAIIHINPLQSLMTSLTDETGANYLLKQDALWSGKTGFRLDFLIYSAIPILIGEYTIFKLGIGSKVYNQIFNLYVATNALWVLCMYVPFNNRIAYLSWFLLPIVSIYPFLRLYINDLKSSQYRMLNKIALFYLFFTLIMSVI